MIPNTARSPRRLPALTEYFGFRESSCSRHRGAGASAQAVPGKPWRFLIYVTEGDELELSIGGVLRLGATPVIICLNNAPSPIAITAHRATTTSSRTSRRLGSLEIYSVDRVTVSSTEGETKTVHPIYG